MEADTAYFYEATQITNLVNVKVTFYDLKGAESSTLTAKTGSYRWQDGSMEANGNVVVVSPDGRRLATERLRYDNASNQISTDRRFTFDRGAEHLEGNSFRSDPGLPERGDRSAARRGTRRERHAAAGAGGASDDRGAAGAAGSGSCSPPRGSWRRPRVLAQGQQCVFQIDNVDRQGAVVETPQGTNYFAGGNVRLSCRGTKITMRERQRRGVRRQRRPVHRPGAVPRLHAHDGRRPGHLLSRTGSAGRPGARSNTKNLGDRLDARPALRWTTCAS